MLEESLSRTLRELNLAKTHWEYRFEGRTPQSGAFVDLAAAEEEPRPPQRQSSQFLTHLLCSLCCAPLLCNRECTTATTIKVIYGVLHIKY